MAIAVVASGGKAGDGTSVTTDPLDTTGADLIIAHLSRFSSSASALTDSKGNTWQALTARQTGGGINSRLYYCASPIVGSGHTFSNSLAGTFPSMAVLAVSGADLSPFHSENGFAAPASVASIQPGSVTPPASGCLIVTGLDNHTLAVPPSIDSGFSQVWVNWTANSMACGLGYLIQGAPAAVNPLWSWAGTRAAASTIAVFKPVGAGGGANPWNYYAQLAG